MFNITLAKFSRWDGQNVDLQPSGGRGRTTPPTPPPLPGYGPVIPDLNDPNIWIQYDLQKPHTVPGFIMMKKCMPAAVGEKYTTSLTLKASNDEITWTTPVDNVTLDYNSQSEVIYWMNQPITSQCWKTWTENAKFPPLKADLLDYLIN